MAETQKKYTYKEDCVKEHVLERMKPGKSQYKLAEEFGVSRITIRRWLEKESFIKPETVPKRKQVPSHAQCDKLDDICLEFLRLTRERGRVVTEPTIQALASNEARQLV